MYHAKIFTVDGVNVTYLFRRVQFFFPIKKVDAPEELTAILQECTTEQLLHYFFINDFQMDEQFFRLFEKRLQELESPLLS